MIFISFRIRFFYLIVVGGILVGVVVDVVVVGGVALGVVAVAVVGVGVAAVVVFAVAVAVGVYVVAVAVVLGVVDVCVDVDVDAAEYSCIALLSVYTLYEKKRYFSHSLLFFFLVYGFFMTTMLK